MYLVITTLLLILFSKYTFGGLCQDCVQLSSCPNAMMLINSQVNTTVQQMLDAYCGFDYYDSKFIHKVCCSKFGIQGPPNLGLLPDNCGITETNNIPIFMWVKNSDKKTHEDAHCAGTIISSKYVLTTAYCVNDKLDTIYSYIHFLYGTSISYSYGPRNLLVEKIIVHPEFRLEPFAENDIALLRVKVAKGNELHFPFVCLPVRDVISNITNKKSERYHGWQYQVLSDVECIDLCNRTVNVNLDKKSLVNKFCTELDRNVPYTALLRPRYPFLLKQDDSENKIVLYGIASRTLQQCGSAVVLYTDIRKYIIWILDTMEP